MVIAETLGLFYIHISTAIALKANYGYIGPACAVADGQLYIHGEPQRDLSASEQEAFRLYQRDLSIYLELKKKFSILEPPKMPAFCGQLTDAAELVLDGCIVREGKVYMNSNLVRLLTGAEEEKIDNIMNSWSKRMRKMKDSPGPGLSPLRDISMFLDRILKVSPAVTKRFDPWFEQSPLISGKAAHPGYGITIKQTSIETTTAGMPQKTLKPSGSVRRRSKNRWDAKFIRSAPPISMPILPEEENIPKSFELTRRAPPISMPTLPQEQDIQKAEKPSPSPERIKSTGQTLLQLLTKTLTDPELMKTLRELEQIPAASLAKPRISSAMNNYYDKDLGPGKCGYSQSHALIRGEVHYAVAQAVVKLKPKTTVIKGADWHMETGSTTQEPEFLPHPVIQWFAKTTKEPERNPEPAALPNEICTAHMKPPSSEVKRRRNLPF